jgi:hypothetical protein
MSEKDSYFGDRPNEKKQPIWYGKRLNPDRLRSRYLEEPESGQESENDTIVGSNEEDSYDGVPDQEEYYPQQKSQYTRDTGVSSKIL